MEIWWSLGEDLMENGWRFGGDGSPLEVRQPRGDSIMSGDWVAVGRNLKWDSGGATQSMESVLFSFVECPKLGEPQLCTWFCCMFIHGCASDISG